MSYGEYPILIKDDHTATIYGEVYDISHETLHLLDALEGNGFLYKRELIDITGLEHKVWCYFVVEIEHDFVVDDERVYATGGVITWVR